MTSRRNSIRIKRDHLTLLFNNLYGRVDDRFTISYLCDEIGDLATIDLGEATDSTVRFDLDLEGYSNASNETVLAHGDAVDRDLPTADAYRNTIVASGIVQIANLEEVTTFLDRYGDPDLMAGHPPVFVGLDTNLLPWRIDRILGLRKPSEGVGYVNGFALATGVCDELDWDVKCHDAEPYVEAYGEVAREFWNQPTGSGRISRLGLSAYREIRDIQQAAELDADRGDEAIVTAYDDWQTTMLGQLLLFSNNRNFVELAQAHTILAQHVDLPRELPKKTIA